MSSISLTVKIERLPNGTAGVTLGYPESQEPMRISEMARILAAGISLCIKLAPDEGLVKDYELMKEITDYLNNEFISLESFNDATIISPPDGE